MFSDQGFDVTWKPKVVYDLCVLAEYLLRPDHALYKKLAKVCRTVLVMAQRNPQQWGLYRITKLCQGQAPRTFPTNISWSTFFGQPLTFRDTESFFALRRKFRLNIPLERWTVPYRICWAAWCRVVMLWSAEKRYLATTREVASSIPLARSLNSLFNHIPMARFLHQHPNMVWVGPWLERLRAEQSIVVPRPKKNSNTTKSVVTFYVLRRDTYKLKTFLDGIHRASPRALFRAVGGRKVWVTSPEWACHLCVCVHTDPSPGHLCTYTLPTATCYFDGQTTRVWDLRLCERMNTLFTLSGLPVPVSYKVLGAYTWPKLVQYWRQVQNPWHVNMYNIETKANTVCFKFRAVFYSHVGSLPEVDPDTQTLLIRHKTNGFDSADTKRNELLFQGINQVKEQCVLAWSEHDTKERLGALWNKVKRSPLPPIDSLRLNWKDDRAWSEQPQCHIVKYRVVFHVNQLVLHLEKAKPRWCAKGRAVQIHTFDSNASAALQLRQALGASEC